MSSARHYHLLAVLLSLLAAGVFIPGLGGGFLFDDNPNIVENVAIHVSDLSVDRLLNAAYSFEPGNGSRPLAMLSFALDFWRAGLNAGSFKATNLLIHALTVLALALFLRQLFLLANWGPRKAGGVALLLAVVWGVHPLQVSTVLYVVQRMQMLGTLFLVLALWAYLGMRKAQIEGRPSRHYGVLVVLLWALAFASKEDSALLPLFTFLLEVTVLQFRAAQSGLQDMLRRGYWIAALLGAGVYLCVVVPHYWHWGVYPGRDFSSLERLLTQGRVLAMYCGQIVLPLPSMMPFYYDDLVISRGLFSPISTILALAFIVALVALAWCFRRRAPLVCFGVLLFFAGHFISSNVLNLEMVFEHRNNFPLVGLVLAIGVSCMGMLERREGAAHAGSKVAFWALAIVGLVLVGATVSRSYEWGEPLRFAERSVELAPRSERAWLLLSGVYAKRSGLDPASPDFGRALALSEKGVEATDSAALLSNIVIFKTMRGDDASHDWERLLDRLRKAPMSVQNKNVLWVMLGNTDKGIGLDPDGMIELIEIVSARSKLTSEQNLRVGAYIHNETKHPELALAYLRRAVELSRVGDPGVERMLQQLREAGRADWASQLEVVARASELIPAKRGAN